MRKTNPQKMLTIFCNKRYLTLEKILVKIKTHGANRNQGVKFKQKRFLIFLRQKWSSRQMIQNLNYKLCKLMKMKKTMMKKK